MAPTVSKALHRFCIGIAMGICDAVPGVSGSTMALIAGIYHRLISEIRTLLLAWRDPKTFIQQHFAKSIIFFAPLAVGIGCGLLFALKLLVGDHGKTLKAAVAAGDGVAIENAIAIQNGWLLQDTTAPLVFAAFSGLILATIPFPWSLRPNWQKRQQASQRATWLGIFFFLCGASAAAVTSFVSMQLTPSTAIFVLGGFCAISAMLLPGISGSLVLLVIGLYQPISIAVRHFEFSVIIPVAIGAIAGAASMVPLLHRLFQTRANDVYATLSGLLAGSMVAVWPWKNHYFSNAVAHFGPQRPRWPTGEEILMPCLVAVTCAIIVVLAQRYRQKLQTKSENIPQ